MILNTIREVQVRYELPEKQTLVAGMSSGAAMVASLLSCHPEEFAAGAIHSGPTYGLADNLLTAAKLLSKGPLPFFDEKGPSSTEMIGKFFKVQ